MSQGLSPSPPSRAWPPAEWPEEHAHSSPADNFFGGLSGLDLDAGQSVSCSGLKHQVVFGPLQVRSSRISGPMLQAPRPHGRGFPVLPLGLLYMRLFLWWMKSLVICPSWLFLHLQRVSGTCLRTLSVWRNLDFLQKGV